MLKMTKPKEEKFEDHFCEKLGDHNYRKRTNNDVDLKFNVDEDLLKEFLEKTQKEELKEVKEDLGKDWVEDVKKEIKNQLKTKKLFEVIKEGINVSNHHLKLIYFKPETDISNDEKERYESNIFSYVRQFKFIKDKQDSIDIVLFLNGMALITIELKSPFNGQVVDDAVAQYINDRDKELDIFKRPILHLAADTKKAKITTEFIRNTFEDFVWFNKDLENPIIENEFQTEYLYNEILLPESLIEIIEHYLNCFEEEVGGKKVRTFFFPRYHQRRTVKKLVKNILNNFEKNKQLNLRYLIQHSAGSGKSYTISVLQKFLRYMHSNNEQVFNSTIILTDRINLDNQIKGTIDTSESQEGLIAYVEKTTELAKALNNNTKVIVTTIQKFSVKTLEEILKNQKDKKICFIIDEAHRSQSGKLHKNMLGHFEPDEENIQEELISGIAKKNFPNLVFIALTATPSEKTITMFSQPIDVYSMDQAEQEKYILNVSDNIVTYNTLFQFSEKLKSEEEYPPLIIAKKLKNKAYEDDQVITDKVNIILKIFDNHTNYAIKNNSAKSMIVTSSRKAAVKYKLILDKILSNLGSEFKSLVAFTGSVKLESDGKINTYTESNMNGKIEKTIEKEFKKPKYRFLIVANKYQYGFNEPLLHTMFLDKSVSNINAVQTISRLNRIYPNKRDTLVVDFTNSHKTIIKAFTKFKKEVNDFSGLNVKDLPDLYNKLVEMNIFTKGDIQEFKKAYLKEQSQIKLENIASKIEGNLNKKFSLEEIRYFRSLLNKFNKTFVYLNNLVSINDEEFRDFALFTYYLFKYLNPLGKSGKIDEELKKVYLKNYKIRLEKTKAAVVRETSPNYGKKKEVRYFTIKEVVEAINSKFEVALSDNEEEAIKGYIDEVKQDPEIRIDIIGNQNDLERAFKLIVAKKLFERFITYFMRYNPEKVSEYIERGLEKFINLEAFRLATLEVKVK